MKRVIMRLTDKELHRIVKESVDRVVQEAEKFPQSDYSGGMDDVGGVV